MAGDPLSEFLAQQDAELRNRRTSPVLPSPLEDGAAGGLPVDQAPSRGTVGGEAAPARGTLVDFWDGVTHAMTFGFDDELTGFTDTLGLITDTDFRSNAETVWNSNKSFGDILSANIAVRRRMQERSYEDSPTANVSGQVFGSIVIPVGAGAKGALQVAKVGAAQGALMGLGDGEGLADRAARAAGGGIAGGVLGAVAGKAVEVASPFVSRAYRALTGRGGAAAEDAAQAAANRIIPDEDAPALAWTERGLEREPVLPGKVANEGKDEVVDLAFGPEGPPAFLRRSLRGADEAGGKAADEVPTSAGTISRAGLTALQDDVAKFRARIGKEGDRAADITRAATPEDAARVGEFRLGTLGDGPDTAALLSALVRQLPKKAVRSDQELMTTARAAANEVGEDPEAWLALGRSIAGQLGDADGAMAALRTVWTRAAKEINDLTGAGIDWASASDEMVEHAGSSIRNVSLLSQMVQQAKVGLGRGLRVNSLPDADAYAKVLREGVPTSSVTPPREMPTLPGTRKEIKDWLDLWGMAGADPRKQAEFLQGILTVPTAGKYLRTSFANFFTASILSAPKTVLLNLVGPGFISVVRNVERMTGAAAISLNPFASAAERQSARAVARATVPAYIQTLTDVGDVFRQAMLAAERNHTIIGGGGQTIDAVATYGPLTENLLNASGTAPDFRYTLGNLINVWPKAFARVNNGLDEFSKRLAYQGEVRVRAMVEAGERGLKGDEAAEFVANKLKDSYDEVGAAADNALLRQAERTTFTAQVGDEGTWVRRFAVGMQGLRRDIPEVRYLLPVFNVPANALGETLRRLPLTRMPFFGKRAFPEMAAELVGERGPVAQADAHGRFMLGSAFLTAGVLMNRMGILTGAGPQEPTDRKVWLQTHQPYSIRVGDEWVRYDKFDILGGLLSVPATISDATTYRAADKGMEELMWSGAGALAQWFKDRAALRNAAGLLALGDDPTKDTGRFMSQFAGNTVSGFFPRALTTLLGDTQDPYARMRRDWDDYLKAAIPGLSQQLEPVRNVLGEPVQRAADTFMEAVFPVTMSPAVTYKDDPVMDELDRVYQVTGYGAGADPRSLGYGFFDPKDVKLEDGRSLYDRAMQMRQTLQVDGKTLRDALLETINSEDYASAVDADPMAAWTSLGDRSRGFMLRQVFDRYNAAIKAEVGRTSPIGLAYLTAAAAKQRDDAYLRNVSAEDLVNNPDLYGTNGVDPEVYSNKVTGGGGEALLQSLGITQ